MVPVLNIGSWHFYSFGLVFGIAICLGSFTVLRFLRTHGLVVNEPLLGALVIGFGLVGAKLDGLIVYGFLLAQGHADLKALLELRQGYTYLGAVLFGSTAAAVYIWANRLPMLRCFDGLFCIGISYAVGRIGCFLAGDGDYGIPSNLPWAVSFPHGVVPTLARVHPTMLYSSLWEFAIFAILWPLSNPSRRPALKPGILLATYLIASGTGRFLVEFLSRNRVLSLGLKEAQIVSLAMMLAGAGILLLSTRQNRDGHEISGGVVVAAN
jgi:phosphatidylglycerol:prolipoprotein diacylglycerol transferase